MSEERGDTADPNVQTEEYDPRAAARLKPVQVEQMRNAAVANSPAYLAERNDAIIATLYGVARGRTRPVGRGAAGPR